MRNVQFSRQFMLHLYQIKISGKKTENFRNSDVGRIGPRALTLNGCIILGTYVFCHFGTVYRAQSILKEV